MRSWALFVATLCLLLGASALFLSIALRRLDRGPEVAPGEVLYREVMQRAMRDHVDPIDEEAAVYAAVKGLASELDVHSRVFDPAEWVAFQREHRGEMTGIGIEVETLADALFIGRVVPHGPADRAGLRAGDRILEIRGAADSTPGGMRRALRGEDGAVVELVVGGRDGSNPRRIEVARATVEVSTVQARMFDDAAVLYVRITAFRPKTGEAFLRQIAAFPPDRVRGVVLDLRFNRGGAFDPAITVADAWLAGGVIVRTRGPRRDEAVEADAEAVLWGVPTVVLVNGTTASAAEIVAGALQDTHVALLVGERTFGKGVVQEIVEFESGWPGGMKLTTARYFTPANRCIDRGLAPASAGEAPAGIIPDFVVPHPGRDAALERALAWDTYPAWLRDALRGGAEPAAAEDPQLVAALAVLRGAPPDRRL